MKNLVLIIALVLLPAPAVQPAEVDTAVPELFSNLPYDGQLVFRLADFPAVINSLCEPGGEFGLLHEIDASIYDVSMLKYLAEKIKEFSGFLDGEVVLETGLMSKDDSGNYLLYADGSNMRINITAKLKKKVSKELIAWIKNLGARITTDEIAEGKYVYNIDGQVFFGIHNDSLFLSQTPDAVRSFALGKPPYEKSLADNPTFQKTISNIGPADITIYANTGIYSDYFEKVMSRLGREMYLAFGLDKFRAVGLSYNTESGHAAGVIDVALSDNTLGLPAMITGPNTKSELLDFVPADYELVIRLSTANLPRAWEAWLDFVRASVDDIGWADYQKWVQEKGAVIDSDIEQDIVNNFNGEIIIAIKLQEVFGIPKVLVITETALPASTMKIISKLLKAHATGFSRRNYEGIPIITITTDTWIMLSYAIIGNRLIMAQSSNFIIDAIEADNNREGITSNPGYKLISGRVPDRNIFSYYADTKALYQKASNFFLSFISMTADYSEADYAEALKFIDSLKPYIDQLGSSAGSVTFSDNHLTFRNTSNAACAKLMVRAGLEFFKLQIVPEILATRERTRLVNCMNNLKQLTLGMHLYADDHDKKFPDKLSDLYPDYIPPLNVFICSMTDDQISGKEEIDELGSYLYFGKGLTTAADPNTPIIADRRGNHDDGGAVGYADGHVQFHKQQSFEDLLNKIQQR